MIGYGKLLLWFPSRPGRDTEQTAGGKWRGLKSGSPLDAPVVRLWASYFISLLPRGGSLTGTGPGTEPRALNAVERASLASQPSPPYKGPITISPRPLSPAQVLSFVSR